MSVVDVPGVHVLARVGGQVLVPGALFHAEIGGRVARRPYRFTRMRDEWTVDATGWRGGARTIPLNRITRVRRTPPRRRKEPLRHD